MGVKRSALLADENLRGNVVESMDHVGERTALRIRHSHWCGILKRRLSHRGRETGRKALCNILSITKDDPLGIAGCLEPFQTLLALSSECESPSLTFKVLLLALPL